MDEENRNFDNTVPSDKEQTNKAASNSKSEKANNLKELAQTSGITAYAFVGALKTMGHSSLGDLIFRDTMTMICAAGLASESIGRERFTEFLEKGFYATGRLLVYLNFAGSLGVNDNDRESLIESITGVHKIFAASLRTVRSKQVKQNTYV